MNEIVDKVTENFGPKPTPKQVSKMARYRGFTYQRNEAKNQDKPQASVLKVPPPPSKSIVPTNTKLNIDLRGWLNNAKMLVLVAEAEIMKIPSQKGKLLNAIEDPPQIHY
jgi:hypothetical protein